MARPMFGTVAVAILFAAVDGKLVAASGLIDSLAFLLVKARVSGAAFCAVSFLLCCLLSMSTGTSVGTYVVSMPLLFPLGILGGCRSSVPHRSRGFPAVFSGIIWHRFQIPPSPPPPLRAPDMGDVVKSRCFYSLPVAAACFIAYFFLGGSSNRASVSTDLSFRPLSLVMLAVPVVIIVLCLKKMHLIAALSWGIAAGLFAGLATGLYVPGDSPLLPGRASGWKDSFLKPSKAPPLRFSCSSGAFLFLGIVEGSGLIDFLSRAISRLPRGRRSAELIIALSVGSLGAITGVCTVSMIALGDIVNTRSSVGQPDGLRRSLPDVSGPLDRPRRLPRHSGHELRSRPEHLPGSGSDAQFLRHFHGYFDPVRHSDRIWLPGRSKRFTGFKIIVLQQLKGSGFSCRFLFYLSPPSTLIHTSLPSSENHSFPL